MSHSEEAAKFVFTIVSLIIIAIVSDAVSYYDNDLAMAIIIIAVVLGAVAVFAASIANYIEESNQQHDQSTKGVEDDCDPLDYRSRGRFYDGPVEPGRASRNIGHIREETTLPDQRKEEVTPHNYRPDGE